MMLARSLGRVAAASSRLGARGWAPTVVRGWVPSACTSNYPRNLASRRSFGKDGEEDEVDGESASE